MYDSGLNSTQYNSRSWRYGVSSVDIEAAERMGERTFLIPEDVRELELRYSVTGHGSDKGYYPNRPDMVEIASAEFDENYYYFKLNGRLLDDVKGVMWYNNREINYVQGGMARTPRCSWGPGLPVNVQYWSVLEIPENRILTLDIDLEPFVTEGSYSQYIVLVDLFGYK